MDERQIVRNIKKLRQNKKMSLEQLAKNAGLTKGYVSKIENAHKAPPVSTLIKIARALDTGIDILLADKSEPPEEINLCIVKKNEGKEVISKGTLYGYNYISLAYKKMGKSMEPYIIEPAFDEKAVFSHEGEEFMYVLEGTHEFVYAGKKYLLRKGDSIYFNSKIPHSGRSIGKKRAKILTVTMPPLLGWQKE
jgi:transcriptional regulator with XRE-family HTH domain